MISEVETPAFSGFQIRCLSYLAGILKQTSSDIESLKIEIVIARRHRNNSFKVPLLDTGFVVYLHDNQFDLFYDEKLEKVVEIYDVRDEDELFDRFRMEVGPLLLAID